MLRVHAWEGERRAQGIKWAKSKQGLAQAMRYTTQYSRLAKWPAWHASHAPTILEELAQNAADRNINMTNARIDITGVPVGPLTEKAERRYRKGTQNWFARRLLSHDGFCPEMRIRHKASRWRLAGLPGPTARRIHKNLHRLKAIAPPRVRAAVLSTLFNRWTTDRRMRSLRACNNGCRMGCPRSAQDSLEHYVHCDIIRQWAERRLPGTSPQQAKEQWMLATAMTDDQLGRAAIIVYVAYRTTQHVRHVSGPTPEYIRHYMNQMLHEAIRDSSHLRAAAGGTPTPRRRRHRAAFARSDRR